MAMTGRPTVLFVCPDNGGLSLLAEAVALKEHPELRVFSAAALTPGAVDPALVACLDAAGIPADGLSAKPAGVFALSGAPRLDVLVTFGDEARRALRRLPLLGLLHLETWHPVAVRHDGAAGWRRAAYRRLLPEIGAAIANLEARIALRLSGAAA
ncbi:hypothetical protein EZH22_04570 [Xanthobacter dioxanivorans]|uniref:Phosphotyrosine protein phosphatase I domain-containing protein n=1 Tax=Xanthobacter dioxanivorans TaxID=2528964 RepID=A0A974SJN8_9HYPH|nr:hypothetical protein [Xanthobacter dioxanivorans]QRG07672.1 hypothetical protein EZH22_04570 [Xanthobacter dioxanivorans]